jgi:hypothetical protein
MKIRKQKIEFMERKRKCFFFANRKRKWNHAFRWNRCKNKIFYLCLIWNFCLRLLCMENLANPIYDLVKLNFLSKPIPYFSLHRVVSARLGNRFLVCWFAWVFLHDSRGVVVTVIIRFVHAYIVFGPYIFSDIYFHIYFWCLCIHFCFQKNMKANAALVNSVRSSSVYHLYPEVP